MIKRYTETFKEGNTIATYTWEVDTSKPNVVLDGCQYLFNKTLVSKEVQFKNEKTII